MKKNGGYSGSGKNVDTVIGEEIIFENAILKGGGVIRIDGKLSGTVDINGHISIGETGVVEGDVCADNALIAGTYKGSLNIQGVLHVTSTAVISGRVESGKLIVDEGAIFNEVTTLAKPDAAAAKAAPEVTAAKAKPENPKTEGAASKA